jgi:hypothetical protein
MPEYRNFFLFLNFIPALINMYNIHLSFPIFLTLYPYFAFKKHTGTSKFTFRSLIREQVLPTGQVKGDDPDQKGYLDPSGWGLGVSLTNSHRKNYCYETQKKPREWRRVLREAMTLTEL